MWKVNFGKKSGNSHWEIFVSYTTQECDPATTTCHPVFALLSVKWSLTAGRLQTKENFKFLALKVVAVAYERWSLTTGSKYSDLAWKRLVFWRTDRWGEVRLSHPEVRLYMRMMCKLKSYSAVKIYERSYISTTEKDMKTWLIIKVIRIT